MPKVYGSQSQVFSGLVQDIGASQPACWKFIDPDSSILSAVKSASPSTKTIVRIYTGAPTVDDASQHPDPEKYGYDYATLVYSRVKDPANMDLLETENEPFDHYNNLTEFIRRQNAFLVGFSRRARELGFKPLGPNFSTGYPEVFIPGSDYQLWPNAWQGLVEGLRALKAAGGGLSLHEYDSPDLFRYWSDIKQLGYLVGRHKAVYKSLPGDLQDLPLWITEFEVDWLTQGIQGGFWHNRDENAPYWMCQQMRDAWQRIYSTTPQLRGICFFLTGRNNAMWEEYDTKRTDTSSSIFTNFWGEVLPGVNPIPDTGWYPKAVKRPLTQHNYWDGRNGKSVTAVCLHIAAGPMSAIYPTFNAVGGQASAHFAVSKTGVVEQYVSINDSAWANGVINRPSWGGLQKDANGNYINPNYYTISIEHEGVPEDFPTPEMNAARNELLVWISQQLGWRNYAFGSNLIGHYMIDSVNRPNCPGPNFNFNLISQWVNDTLNPPVPVPPPTGVIIVTQPFVMPDALAPFATAVPYVPTSTEYFYRLSPKAVVRQGVSAFAKVTFIDELNAPDIGVVVVNVRPDGKGEFLGTDGNGTVQFNFGAGSAFSNPGQGPFTIFAVNSANKDDMNYVSWDKILSDKIGSLGDWQGQHTEIYLQFRKIKADVVLNPATLDDAIRHKAYALIGPGAYNPGAALQNVARQKNLKAVLTNEFEVVFAGVTYICQGFVEAILYTIKGQYAFSDFKTLNW